MICKSKIAILMATYNGERYIREQIDSILCQTLQDWHLFVHDDGSKDGTVAIVKEYCSKHLDKITLLDYPVQGGVCKNFESLLAEVEAEYYMFCDQDDVWEPNKVETEYSTLLKKETVSGKNIPQAVYTDMSIVDKDLKVIRNDMLRPEHLALLNSQPQYMVVSSCVAGCTMCFNRKARDLALPFPDGCYMHDYRLVASALSKGELTYIPQKLIKYRQHETNVLGANGEYHFTLGNMTEKISMLKKIYNTTHPIYFHNVWHLLYWKLRFTIAFHLLK